MDDEMQKAVRATSKRLSAWERDVDYADFSGTELSALVAERVMGWTRAVDGPQTHWHDKHANCLGHVHGWTITDPRDYMAVVEAMRARGWYMMLDLDEHGHCGVSFHHGEGWDNPRGAEATDIGRAIAIAALRAVSHD